MGVDSRASDSADTKTTQNAKRRDAHRPEGITPFFRWLRAAGNTSIARNAEIAPPTVKVDGALAGWYGLSVVVGGS